MTTSLNALVLKISANTDGVSAGVRAVRSDINRINRIMRMSATETEKATNATESLNRVYKTGALTNREYLRGLDAIQSQYKTTGKAATKLLRLQHALSRAWGGTTDRLRRASSSMNGFILAGAGIGGMAVGFSKVRESMQSIDELAKTSDKLGISTEMLSAYRFAAEETAGVANDQFDTALQRMVRRLAEAAQGTGEAKGALIELGLNAQKLATMTPDQQFAKVADAMNKVTNQSDRVRLAMKLFDSEGVGLVNTLKIGSEGLEEYEERARKLGLTVSRFDAAQIEKANDAFGRISKVVEGLQNQLAIQLAPVVEMIGQKFTAWGTGTTTASERIHNSLKKVSVGVGFVADGIEFWIRTFKSVRAYASEFFAWMASKTLAASKEIARLLNKIPGVETKPSDFTAAFASTMADEAKKARKIADEAWSKPWSSEGINASFDQMTEKMQKARAEFDEAARKKIEMEQASPIPDSVSKLLDRVQSMFSGFRSLFNQSNESQTKPIKVELPPAAEKSSREEFQLRAEVQKQQMRKAAEHHQKSMAIWGVIAKAVESSETIAKEGNQLLTDIVQGIQNIEPAESV